MSTIVAISTAPAIGGIGIVRMSGKDCFKIIEKIFKPKNSEDINNIKGYSIKYGNIINPKTKKVIDEVLVMYFKSPKSYTTEDMCEINTHGGMVVIREILDLCLSNGAILATPGEFTERAFLNGRIDLTQAEATVDIINATTKKASEAATHQLAGALSLEINKIKQKTMDIMVDIEANIDYPEYDIEEITNKKILEGLQTIQKELANLAKTFEEGKIIKEGIKMAIIGSPNAGKSSLLNAILREDRAIVTEIEGTTRDTIEENIQIEGIPFKIIDTAGIRDSDNKIEKIGIEKTRKIAKESDLIIAMFDISKDLSVEDKEILEIIKDKKAIIVLNKLDLNKEILTECKEIINATKPIIKISALNKQGIDKIYKEIIKMFNLNEINLDNEVIVTNQRHQELIKSAILNLKKTIKTLEDKMPIDIIAINIKDILEDLAEITGQSVSEDIIKEIFAKFCLGK